MWSTKYIKSIVYFFILTSLVIGCRKQSYTELEKGKFTKSPPSSKNMVFIDDLESLSQYGEEAQNIVEIENTRDPLHYVPEDSLLYPTRTIRFNVHFMHDDNGDHNFTEKEGRSYMWHLIKDANKKLKMNPKMNLPHGNNTPNYHPRYEYRLTSSFEGQKGYYHHNDSDLCFYVTKGKNKNNYSKTVLEKYQIGGDSILNLFVMPHHPDSLATGRYKPFGTGIALSQGVKVAGLVENQKEYWKYTTLINHEIGHFLGLKHSWTRHDGCDDTPAHPNCWQPSDSGECKGPVSNNMMDYNNSQLAISPCQLGIIHKGISTLDSKFRKVVKPIWCKLDPSVNIVIKEDTVWPGALDLNKNVIVKKGAKLTIASRVSMPPNSSIKVEPGGELVLQNSWLHNDCNKTWKGILILSSGNTKGKVSYSGNVKLDNINAKS